MENFFFYYASVYVTNKGIFLYCDKTDDWQTGTEKPQNSISDKAAKVMHNRCIYKMYPCDRKTLPLTLTSVDMIRHFYPFI